MTGLKTSKVSVTKGKKDDEIDALQTNINVTYLIPSDIEYKGFTYLNNKLKSSRLLCCGLTLLLLT